MRRNISVCFALMLLAACNAQGLNSATSAGMEIGTAADKSLIEYEEKNICASQKVVIFRKLLVASNNVIANPRLLAPKVFG